MLISYSITTDAFEYYDSPIAHRRAIELFTLYGILTYCGDLGNSKTAKAIRNLPQQARVHWLNMLSSSRSRQIPSSCEILMDNVQLNDLKHAQGHIDLICVDPVNGADFSIDQNTPTKALSGFASELALLDHVDISAVASKNRPLAGLNVPAGRVVTKLWEERFSGLASVSSRSALVDGYAVTQFMERNESGLRRLLIETDGSSNKRIAVDVISTMPARYSKQDISNRVKQLGASLTRGGVGSINLYLIDQADYRPNLGIHDRWLRFDKFSYFSLASGISVLDGAKTSISHDLSFKLLSTDLKQIEKRAIEHAKQRGTVLSVKV